MIYVDRLNNEQRRSAIDKMRRILDSGSSVLIFPEGGLNNFENLLVQKLFSSPHKLAQLTGRKVVPIVPFNEYGDKHVYITVGDPLDLSGKDKKEALRDLRDCMATMMYEHIENHGTVINRSELGANFRMEFMEERRREYLTAKWTRDVWDEELTVYQDRETITPEQVWTCFDDVRITMENVNIVLPVVKEMIEASKYDFKRFMKASWNVKY